MGIKLKYEGEIEGGFEIWGLNSGGVPLFRKIPPPLGGTLN
jgi:hypothetical protein